MEGTSTRQLKVAGQIKRDIAEIIRSKGMAAYDGAMVSVSGVKVSPDLSLARMYISIFPSDKTEKVMEIINATNRSLRGELGRRVAGQFRIVPELSFYVDDSLDYVEHIDSLLKQ